MADIKSFLSRLDAFSDDSLLSEFYQVLEQETRQARSAVFHEAREIICANLVRNGTDGLVPWPDVEANIRMLNTCDLDTMAAVALGQASFIATQGLQCPILATDMARVLFDVVGGYAGCPKHFTQLPSRIQNKIISDTITYFYKGQRNGNSKI